MRFRVQGQTIKDVVHLFDADVNRAIAKTAARALKPGGYFVIQDFLRPDACVQNLFFSVLSAAGTSSCDEERSWQSDAGLVAHKVIRFVSSPLTQVVAAKPKQP